MQFHRPARTRSQVPIVPMIDILFILLIFFIVFGGIISALTWLNFTPVSTFIFLLFLSIVSFFGIRIRLP